MAFENSPLCTLYIKPLQYGGFLFSGHVIILEICYICAFAKVEVYNVFVVLSMPNWRRCGYKMEALLNVRFEVPLQTKSSADTADKCEFSLDHFLIVFSDYTATLQKLLQSGTLH